MARHRQWHVSGWPAILLVPLILPLAAAIALGERFLGLSKTADLTADDVVGYLEDFRQGRGGDWDWDDFTSISITDPALEAIREEADLLMLPLEPDGEAKLNELLDRARSLASRG
jgi:hypothetical protein